MNHTRFLTTLLAGGAALVLALAGPSCNCGAGGGDDGGQDAGDAGDGGGETVTDGGNAAPTRQVLEFHGSPSRAGGFVDPSLTRAFVATSGFHLDPGFAGGYTGITYAQPLYFENSGGRPDLVVVATESNDVIAFDATDGGTVWKRTIAPPIPHSALPCGNIAGSFNGITGTPVIDPQARALYLSAEVAVSPGPATHHQVFGLSLDDGSTLPGWPQDVNVKAVSGSTTFNAPPQGQRSALSLVNGTLYVPFGGRAGDCGSYRGWVVGIPTSNPSSVTSWATRAGASGIWATGGLASDGTSLYGATGNAIGATGYGDQESVIRFAAGPVYSQANQDHYVPSNWQNLDGADTDISGSGPLLVDLPGSTPSALIVQLGKDHLAYLIDRNDMGGQGAELDTLTVSTNAIIQAGAVYRTPLATYVAMAATGTGCAVGTGDLTAIKVNPGSPPRLASAWCATQSGRGSPIVTTADGLNEAVVWSVGSSDGRLRAFNGDTGERLFASTDVVSGLHSYSTAPIFAKGRFYVVGDNRLFSFIRR